MHIHSIFEFFGASVLGCKKTEKFLFEKSPPFKMLATVTLLEEEDHPIIGKCLFRHSANTNYEKISS